jgi:chemotaxis protein MotA
MFIIIGLVIVFGCVLGGFVLMKGPIAVLIQPAELVVIFGAVIGSVVIGTPFKMLGLLAKKIPSVLKGSPYNKTVYLELLLMQYEVFINVKKGGWLAIEEDVTTPAESSIFTRSPKFLANHHARGFFCDALMMLINGAANAEELDLAMDAEIETHHEEGAIVPGILNKASDALPGLGIVAAVLGIVVTMQHIDGPPEEIGHHVAAALVGTFLGLLLSYGLLSPIATNLEKLEQDEAKYYTAIKAGLISFASGSAPSVAVEFARRAIFSVDRPDGADLESAMREIRPR